MDALERVKHVLAQLPREDQAALAEFLRGLVVTPEEAEEMLDPSRERVVATVTHRSRKREDGTVAAEPTITYRLERVKCGKKGCAKCPHGPYVYKYWREGGRLRKAYGGRPARLPDPERDPAQATFAPQTGELNASRRRAALRPAAGAPPQPRAPVARSSTARAPALPERGASAPAERGASAPAERGASASRERGVPALPERGASALPARATPASPVGGAPALPERATPAARERGASAPPREAEAGPGSP